MSDARDLALETLALDTVDLAQEWNTYRELLQIALSQLHDLTITHRRTLETMRLLMTGRRDGD